MQGTCTIGYTNDIFYSKIGLLYSSLAPKKAEREFKTVLEKFPDYFRTHNNLGILYMDQGEMELAEQSFLEASESNLGMQEATTTSG